MRYDLRTKPSVPDGITFDQSVENVRLVEYQPGNGTRYQLAFTQLSALSGAPNLLGCQEACWVVSYLNQERCAILAPAGFLHFTYVAQKFGCGASDAIVLAELIGFILGRAAVPCEEVTAIEDDD